MRFLEPALALAGIGWQVFPVSPGSKLPAIPKAEGGQGVLDVWRMRGDRQ